MRISLLLAVVVMSFIVSGSQMEKVLALDNGMALTPQMGWNSWNYFGCNVSDALIRSTADSLVSSGLSKLGYEYVNIDDCWQVSRDSNGVIVPDPDRFPYGMKALADYVHSVGLKLGVYSDAGNATCQGRPGSLGHEQTDANTYAQWGVDYLKYDNCNNDNIPPETRYPPMRDALNSTGRHILFSMCEWGVDQPYIWAPAVGNSWRTTGDISDNWTSMMSNIVYNDIGWESGKPGQWNDPDMLEIGNGGMSAIEYQTHFSLWCVTKAPLIIGCDATDMQSGTLDILSNMEVIAINQDPMGVQGRLLVTDPSGIQVWSGPLANGDLSALIVNTSGGKLIYTLTFSKINAPNCNVPRDLWAHVTLPQAVGTMTVTLNSHESALFRLTQC